MKRHRYSPKLALLMALMSALLFTITGYGGAEVFASDTRETQTLTETKNEQPLTTDSLPTSVSEDNSLDSSELLPIEEIDGEYVLTMSDEEWDRMTDIELWVFLDDGEGYIDLGRDARYDFDGTNLYVTYDNAWVALDGQIVCFFNTEYVVEDDGYWYNYGVVPILYEEEEAWLELMWDSDHPEGYVSGWRYAYTGSESQDELFELKDGMYFDFLCDYYTYDDEYDGQYLFGDMTVDGPVTVGYEAVGDGDYLVYYALYDINNNIYWTEPMVFSWDSEG